MSRMLSKQLVFVAATLIFLVAGRGPLHAEIYHIGSDQPEDGETYFADLESLYNAHPALHDDTVILYKNDTSLTRHTATQPSFEVTGTVHLMSDSPENDVTIDGQGVADRLFYISGTLNISEKITFENFNSTHNGVMTVVTDGSLNAEGVFYLYNESGTGSGGVDSTEWMDYYQSDVSTGLTREMNFKRARFVGNTAPRGAVVVFDADHADFTDATFINNSGTRSGAISSWDASFGGPTVITMGASAGGSSLYQGNMATSTGVCTSLYFAGAVVAGTTTPVPGIIELNIVVGEGGKLHLMDRIYMDGVNLFEAYIDKSGAGEWNLGGITEIDTGRDEHNRAEITISQGTLCLLEGTEIHMTGTNDSFTAKKGTIVSINGGNTLTGTTVLFEAGSTLNFDMNFYHVQGNHLSDAMLSLSGNTLEVAGTNINVLNLPDGPDGYGDYILIKGQTPLNVKDFILRINDRIIDVSGAVSDRFGYSLGNTANEKELVLQVRALQNTILRWQNYESANENGLGDQWSIYGKNWDMLYESPVKIDSYVYGDTVLFDLVGDHTVSLDDTVVIGPNAKPSYQTDPNFYVTRQVGMHVDGPGNWTFTGSSITDASLSDPTRRAGLLFSGSGTLTLANAAANTYTGGTTISGGGTLKVGRMNLLGSGGITFENNLANTLEFTGSAVFDQTITVGVNGQGILTAGSGVELTVSNAGMESAATISGGRLTIRGSDAKPIRVYDNFALDGGAVNVGTGSVGSIEHAGTFEAVNTLISGNMALYSGGAVSAVRSNVHVKDSYFANNRAGEKGGAIYYHGGDRETLTIEASAGKTTTFTGNEANGDANSIHIDALTVSRQDATVEIRTGAGGTVDMVDPMSGHADAVRTISITKTGTGTWNLGGQSVFEGNGKTLWKISEGTLSLYKSGELDLQGTFTLASEGTLLANGANEITATTLRLENGAKLAFDMTDVETNNPAFLDMQAENWNTSSWSQKIDLKNYSAETIQDDTKFVYNLMTLNDGTVTTDNMTLLYRGQEMKDLRENFGELKVVDSGGGKLLVVEIVAAPNGVTIWNPTEHLTWDASSKNWTGSDYGLNDITGTTQFLHGDAVFFNDDGAGEVRVAAAGVEIARQTDRYRGLTVDNTLGNTYTFSGGPIDGSGALLKQGDGTVVFADTNTFTGGTTIENGEVVAQRVTALGSSDVLVAEAGTLRFDVAEDDSGTFFNAISGAGRVIKTEYGNVKLTGKNSYSGGTEVRTGGLILGNVDAVGDESVVLGDQGSLIFEDVIGTGTRPVEFTNLLSGTGAVRATGKTNLLLSGENTYSGGTSVADGATITIHRLSAVGIGNLSVDGAFVFDLDTNMTIDDRTINGNGVLRKIGSGDLTLSSMNYFSGTMELLEGRLLLGDAQALRNATLDYSGGTFSFGLNAEVGLGGLAGDRDLVLKNDNDQIVHLTIGSNASDQNYEGILSGQGSVTKVGRGTQTFSRTNTYSGGTVVSGGRLVAVGIGALGAGSVQNDAELEFEIQGKISETYEKIISGTGSLIKSGTGTLALAAENSYKDGTVVEEGTLKVDSLRAVGMHLTPTSDRTGTITIGPDGRLVLHLDENAKHGEDDYVVTRNIDGSGTFVKEGNGTVLIARELSFAGNIDIVSGTLFMNGKTGSSITVRDGGVLAGTGTVDNALLFERGANHRIDYSDVNRLGSFTANSFQYEGGSTIYFKIGKNGADQLVAREGFDFATGGGIVNVVLLNMGDSGESNVSKTYELFRSEDGVFRINGQYVSTKQAGDDFLTLNGEDGIFFRTDPDQDLSILGHSVRSNGDLSKGIYLDVFISGSGSGLPVTSPGGTTWTMTPNQSAVFEGIGEGGVYDKILSYQKSARGDVLNQLTPMIQTVTPYLTQRSVTQFNTATFERLRFRRNTFLRPVTALDDTTFGDEELYRGRERRLAKSIDGRNDLWFQNYGDFIRMHSRGQSPAFQADSYGFNLGVDRDVHHHATVGLGLGGYFSEVRANDYYQKGDVDAFLISAYGDWRDDNLVVSASTGLVASRYTLERSVTSFNTVLDSKHNGTTAFISGEASRKWCWGACELTPFVGLDLIWMWEDAYRERAKGDQAIALAVKKEYNASVLGNVGLRIGRTFRLLGGNIVSPSIHAAWIHDYNQGGVTSRAGFSGEPVFTVSGASMHRDRAKVGANVDMTINNRMDMFGRFDAEFSHRMNSMTFHWGIRMGF